MFQEEFESLRNRFNYPRINYDRVYKNVSDNLPQDADLKTFKECLIHHTSNLVFTHYNYGVFAGNIAMTMIHEKGYDDIKDLYKYLNTLNFVDNSLYSIVMEYGDKINEIIDYSRDFNFDYFAVNSLKKTYLFPRERPQQMFMRVILTMYKTFDHDLIKQIYDNMSNGYYTHASPTLINAGRQKQQMSSCFLLGTDDDINSIMDTLKNGANISQTAGGLGLHIHKIRPAGSYIKSSNGYSSGIVKLLRMVNAMVDYVDQGGKRSGACAVYLEPWHMDIEAFIDLKLKTGAEDARARNLFYALWVNDLFMERVEKNEQWTLFDSHHFPNLDETYGEEFRNLYTSYERKILEHPEEYSDEIVFKNKPYRRINAIDLWERIVHTQIETGGPFILFKDACNIKSNQQNLGTIKCSNLCTEIIEYTDNDEIAVCNLASIALPKFVNHDGLSFDFVHLGDITREVVRNLNNVLDANYYPTKETRKSNMKHRPIGIGVQGLADVYIKMNFPFDSKEASDLNYSIFECIYYNALLESNNLARIKEPYFTFKNSPAHNMQLQFDLWEHTPRKTIDQTKGNAWDTLKCNITKYGLRNSLLTAIMPTAGTAQILGNNESVEPYTNNMFTRRLGTGEYQIVNKHMVDDLIKLGLWTSKIRQNIMANYGSIQYIDIIPDDIKKKYRTVWELKKKPIIQQAIDRGPFICQSQSMNIFFNDPTVNHITTLLFFAWKSGLKTGMYYLRTKPTSQPIQFTCQHCSA